MAHAKNNKRYKLCWELCRLMKWKDFWRVYSSTGFTIEKLTQVINRIKSS